MIKAMITKNKRYMTLLELLIGLMLTILLLTTLTYFYQQVTWLDAKAETLQRDAFKLRYVENRLNFILESSLAEYQDKKNFHFFASSNDLNGLLAPNSPSLIFLFDTKVSFDPEHTNDILGRLFLDKQKQFCLATWTAPKEWKETQPPTIHKEILLDNVESLEFKFYVASQKDRSKILNALARETAPTIAEPDTAEQWVSTWQTDYHYLPPMVKVILKYHPPDRPEPEIMTFIIPLPNSHKIPVYDQ